MKRVIPLLAIILASIALVMAVGGGGGNGGGGSPGSGGTPSGGGTTFSAVTCSDDGSILFYMAKQQKIIAFSRTTHQSFEVPGTWDSLGNFRSQELVFKTAGDYNITSDLGTRTFTCPGFKFACSIVSILNAYCIKNQSGITAGLELYNDTEVDNLKFNYGLDQKILTYEKASKSTELRNLTIRKEGNKITTHIPPTIPGILEIKAFEVIHKKCLGKRYIYTRVDCSEFANLTTIDTNALKCSGLLDLRDRVRCRINLESEEEEYQNFYPEECRTNKSPGQCLEIYQAVSPCWDISPHEERVTCLRDKINPLFTKECEIPAATQTCKKEQNEKIITLIKLRFYNLEEQAEILQENGLLDLEPLIEFVTQVELKKQAFNLAKNKEEMKQVIQEVRDLWIQLMKNVKK